MRTIHEVIKAKETGTGHAITIAEEERLAAWEKLVQSAKGHVLGTTLYIVYWYDNGFRGCTYIEVPDNLGRKKVSEVRRIFTEQYGGEIIRIVKDC